MAVNAGWLAGDAGKQDGWLQPYPILNLTCSTNPSKRSYFYILPLKDILASYSSSSEFHNLSYYPISQEEAIGYAQ